jgi:hypothetical protein
LEVVPHTAPEKTGKTMPILIKFQPILPKKKFPTATWERLEKALKGYMQSDLSNMLKGDMEETVEGWSGKPSFTAKYSEPFKTQMQVFVSPSGQYKLRWIRISAGVEGHTITPRRAPRLRFQQNYTPHTQPGGKWGGSGMRSGPTITASQVEWPGIKAREFSKWIAEKRKVKIMRDVQSIVKRNLK